MDKSYLVVSLSEGSFQRQETTMLKKVFHPKAEFKKGHIPWDKGLKRPKLSERFQGKNNPRWEGKPIYHEGYYLIYKPEHPRANNKKYVRRAILVAEKCLGRLIQLPELVHHIGIKYPIDSIENKGDDRPENLYLCADKGEHNKIHGLNLKVESNIVTKDFKMKGRD